MKKYSKGKRQQNKAAKKEKHAAAHSTVVDPTLRIRKRVSGKDSIVSQATAPTCIAGAGDSSPTSIFK